MKKNILTLYAAIIAIIVIGNSLHGSEELRQDMFDASTCLKIAAAGTICVGGYCVYQLWQENKILKTDNLKLKQDFDLSHRDNLALIDAKNTLYKQYETEKRKNLELNKLLQQTEDLWDKSHGPSAFKDFSDDDDDAYFSPKRL